MTIHVEDVVLLGAHFWVKGADEVRITFYHANNITLMTAVSFLICIHQSIQFL